MLPPEAMLISIDCAIMGGHIRHLWSVLQLEAMLMSVDHAANGGHVGVCGPAVVRDCVDVCGPCSHWRPCGCLWSLLSPDNMWKSIICAGADCKGHRKLLLQ